MSKPDLYHEFGVVVGGTYCVAPSLQLVAEYTYAQRHQGGFNFATNGLGAGTTADAAGLTRDARGQGLVMAAIYNEGQAYSEAEYRSWLSAAGFSDPDIRYGAAAAGSSIMIARKR